MYSHLALEVITTVRDSAGEVVTKQEYQFPVSDFTFAMTVHNVICGKNDGREPTLYLVCEPSRMVLNNRFEYAKAVQELKAAQQRGGLIDPRGFPGLM